MCGRFTLTTADFETLLALTGAEAEAALGALYRPRYNVAPMQEHWIVRGEGERRILEPATWGLVNAWARDRREGAQQINARCETAPERPAFRDAFRARRCVVPADGFFEWTVEGRMRRPWWFHRADGGPLLFAGLYEVARLPGEAGPSASFTILTTASNAVVTPVHDRMPVIVGDEEGVDTWLYEHQALARLQALLRPADDSCLVRTPVSTRVNSVANDDPACLVEAEADTQGALL